MTETVRRRRWPFVVVALALTGVTLIIAFRWDWLIPVVESRASAAVGRNIRLSHLHVMLGRTTRVVTDEVSIENPKGWPNDGKFMTADHLTVEFDLLALIQGRSIVLSLIALDHPVIDAQELADKTDNWQFGGKSGSSESGGPVLGKLVINDGLVHARLAPLSADFEVAVHTKPGKAQSEDQIVATAKGTYAKQPITASFLGGSLLSLRNAGDPYPVELKVENGPTSIALEGTIMNPTAFQGANIKLRLAGPDMSLLLPLTGIAIPKTPQYSISSRLDYLAGVVKLTDLAGRVGSTDLEGTLGVDTKPSRPILIADLQSKLVDLRDLSGFIGADTTENDDKKGRSTQNSGKILPDDPISLPKLTVADVHLRYTAHRIEGRRQPLDDMMVALEIVNGEISLHPLSFGVGKGAITSQIKLSETDNSLAMKANVEFRNVDVSKLLHTSGVAEGAGSIGGRAAIEGNGKSLGAILGSSSGEIKLFMGSGGNLSALLVDLSGLQFGNALLSSLGIPNRERIECLITDVSLDKGIAESRLTMLDTNDSRLGITGTIDLKTERIGLILRTQSKHFSIGSLPTPIGVAGSLGSPSIRPDLKDAGVRAAAAVGLGVLLTPIAGLLPTIQFGTGEDHACSGLLQEIKTPPRPSGKVKHTSRRG